MPNRDNPSAGWLAPKRHGRGVGRVSVIAHEDDLPEELLKQMKTKYGI